MVSSPYVQGLSNFQQYTCRHAELDEHKLMAWALKIILHDKSKLALYCISKYDSVLFLKLASMNGSDLYGYIKFIIQSGPHMGCRTSSLGCKEFWPSESRDS